MENFDYYAIIKKLWMNEDDLLFFDAMYSVRFVTSL